MAEIGSGSQARHNVVADAPTVAIVGGGLAGMVAALRLLERGSRVTLLESSARLGGKAGATPHGGAFDEHGYHIFPEWYINVWQIVDELGIRSNFEDCTRFFQVKAGAWPEFHTFTNITSARYAWQNLMSGVYPLHEIFLFFYAALDLTSQSYSERARLDQLTVTGFLRSRFYRTELAALLFEEFILKGISIPIHEVSAMTMRNVMRMWIKSPEPMFRILKGNLQTLWIEPLEQKLRALGADIQLGQKVIGLRMTGDRVTSLSIELADGSQVERSVAHVLLSVPVEKASPLIDDNVYPRAPALGQLRNLQPRPMAAFNIYFKSRVPDIPKGHVNLLGSRFSISFLDVSQYWPGETRTVLNAIAADFMALRTMSARVAVGALMEDLLRFLPPFGPDAVERITYLGHGAEPLFMNNVGGWAFRPNARTEIGNLYLAGDYCRSPIDLVSMEGAIWTGLSAAESIRTDLNLPSPIALTEPPRYPDWLLTLGRIALMPLAALAKLRALLGSEDAPPNEVVPPFDPNALPAWPVEVIDESAPPLPLVSAR